MSDLGSMPLRYRPTADLIVLLLTVIVGTVLIVALGGGIWWKIQDPTADLEDITSRVGDLTNTLIGAIVGYLAGKGAGASGALREQVRSLEPLITTPPATPEPPHAPPDPGPRRG